MQLLLVGLLSTMADQPTSRSLRLHRETLTELSTDELRDVAAGQNLTGNYTPWCPTVPAKDCDFTHRCFTGTTTYSCLC